MRHFEDLREFLEEVKRRGRLYRFTEPVNKETELMPLFRVETRGLPDGERRVLFFDDVRGADGRRYAMKIAAGVYGASRDFVACGSGARKIAKTPLL